MRLGLLQITDNFAFFSDKTEKLKKFANSAIKKLEMLKVDHKTANLATLQNFDICDRKKMDAGIGVSDPKLIKFDWFQTKHIYAVDHNY